ncbi:PREDICTED: putative F-box/LRR-repeat protein 23 isoform X2 [Ipomoea nil]|uniref:putative F-box/LRR-repeat protein 23 isoform X2 n=1 Tax=Ipomoea nil TaxID=35883 RepID=UPI0009014B19|nr:PREDICTED: putative F-box/LRR-repeat protein 23 isoform X2 [Ipomoea nil]
MANAAAPWVDLPRELTANILQRLSVEDIFQSAQVCTAWWRLWQDPSMWRYVDFWNIVIAKEQDWDKICREVVNRSEGQLISIKLGYFATDDLLFYIAQRAKQLRHLGIRSCSHVSDEGFRKAVNEFPVLEELQLEYTPNISKQGIEAAGQSCPFLNSFSFIKKVSGFLNGSSDEEAVAIAENMHGLKHLTLDGNRMTDKGVEAILDACPLLQSLNLDHCNYIWLGGELRDRCSQQIKDLSHHIDNPGVYLTELFWDFKLRDPGGFDEMIRGSKDRLYGLL